MLDIVASYHFMQFHGKLMIQTQENGEKPHFGPNLWLQILLDHHQLSSCTIFEKTNGQILRKFSDGRTDGRTERFHMSD